MKPMQYKSGQVIAGKHKKEGAATYGRAAQQGSPIEEPVEEPIGSDPEATFTSIDEDTSPIAEPDRGAWLHRVGGPCSDFVPNDWRERHQVTTSGSAACIHGISPSGWEHATGDDSRHLW